MITFYLKAFEYLDLFRDQIESWFISAAVDATTGSMKMSSSCQFELRSYPLNLSIFTK